MMASEARLPSDESPVLVRLGAAIVLLIALGIGLNIWPGWAHIAGWVSR